MGKISPISNKYIIYAKIHIEGVVERPDVIGAIFGQTEGLLGSDLELRELQRSGKIARIDVNLDVRQGKTEGEIIIPSSLDKAETAIVAASLETITKIGPCDSKISVEKIEDVRISKRNFLMERAKSLLKDLNENVLPDSHEITNQVSEGVKMTDISSYGKDNLPTSSNIENATEIILVEGRADVLNLLRHGFKDVLGIGGTAVTESIKDICNGKVVTLFVDGDRGGDLIIKKLADMIKIDFVAKAPDGKEVEELAQKEIHKALRSKVPYGSQTKDRRRTRKTETKYEEKNNEENRGYKNNRENNNTERRVPRVSESDKEKFKLILEELIGSKAAVILNNKKEILGKIPIKELSNSLRGLKDIYAIILDGTIDRDVAYSAERSRIKYLVGTQTDVTRSRVNILLSEDLN